MVRDDDLGARFRIASAVDVARDPGGHAHHWTILVGRVEHGVLRVGDELSIPGTDRDAWLGKVIGFARFREELGGEAGVDGRDLGVAVWGVAPPGRRVAPGSAVVVGRTEAAALAARLREEEPAVVEHCFDCRRVVARFALPDGAPPRR